MAACGFLRQDPIATRNVIKDETTAIAIHPKTQRAQICGGNRHRKDALTDKQSGDRNHSTRARLDRYC